MYKSYFFIFFSKNSVSVYFVPDTCLVLGVLSLPSRSSKILNKYANTYNSCKLINVMKDMINATVKFNLDGDGGQEKHF